MTLGAPESDVLKAVEDVVEDSLIHGTWVYEKDKAPISGAYAVKDSAALSGDEGASRLFYKVADKVVAPRFFKGSTDVGRITIRYLVQGVGPATTRLQIDAIFTEDGRKKAHPSTGAVEAAEYHAVDAELKKMQAMGVRRTAQAQGVSTSLQEPSSVPPVSSTLSASSGANLPEPPTMAKPAGAASAEVAQDDLDTLKSRVSDLRRKVEMRVAGTGTPLKSSPFHSSATLASLPGKAEILILIVTPHWLGVETQGGQHGWVQRSQLELLP